MTAGSLARVVVELEVLYDHEAQNGKKDNLLQQRQTYLEDEQQI